MDSVLRQRLVTSISNKKWTALNDIDLDAEFAALTVQDKQLIIDSLKNADNRARDFIRGKLQARVTLFAETEADRYVLLGHIPNDELNILID